MHNESAPMQSPGRPQNDPYQLTPNDIKDPPSTFVGRVRFLGPGMLTSAAVVGSGELITTTALGAEAGFALLWLVIISALAKVWVQIELGQWTIVTGKTALDGYSTVGPTFFGLGVLNILWIVNELPKLIQRGGNIGAAAAAGSLAFPLLGTPLSAESMGTWVVLLAVSLGAILFLNRYRLIERLATISVLALVATTLVLALGLPLTPFSYSAHDLSVGLSFHVPAGALGIAIAMFGLTGFTAPEINNYGYWCIEKGYARWTGPVDATAERDHRAQGWINVMRLDTLTAWVVTTLATTSFYTIGAAVLHPQGLIPDGNEVIDVLSHMYTDTMGEWAGPLFLFAAFLTLGSTLLAVAAGVPRLWANTFGLLGLFDWKRNPKMRNRIVRIGSLILPLTWALSYFFVQQPVAMIMVGGISDGLLLVAMAYAIFRLRERDVPRQFRKGSFWTPALLVSSIAITAVGVINILEVLGVVPG